MSDEFFTRETWRASKTRRVMQKRVKPWGGRKTAPPAFLAAAKQTYFKPGRVNHRKCSAVKRDGTPCGMLAFKGMKVCGAHGGFKQWAREGRLLKTGRSAARAAEYRAAMVEGRSPVIPVELTRLPTYLKADGWTRMKLAKAWISGPAVYLSLIRQLNQRETKSIRVCV
jgi:hypothetical protein